MKPTLYSCNSFPKFSEWKMKRKIVIEGRKNNTQKKLNSEQTNSFQVGEFKNLTNFGLLPERIKNIL